MVECACSRLNISVSQLLKAKWNLIKVFQRRQLSTTNNTGKTRQIKWTILSLLSGVGVVSGGIYTYAKNGQDRLKTNSIEVYKDNKYRGFFSKLLKVHNVWLIEELANCKFLEEVESFPVNDDDVFVVSFPKSGTTWAQEIVYLIQTNLDVQSASSLSIEDRVPFLEYIYPGLKNIRKQPSPRIVKTHMPYHLLPIKLKDGRGKIIYIARDPRDVCVSNYHFARMVNYINYTGTFEEYFIAFVDGKVIYGPWDNHVLGYWDRRETENLLFITYEEMHKDVIRVIQKISAFLGKEMSEADCKNVAKRCSFMAMKSNPACNYDWLKRAENEDTSNFMRKGVVGDWRNYFTKTMEEDMNMRYRERLKQHQLNKFNFDDVS